jgi:DNA-binding MarR family transcriptional regulator
LAVSRAGVVSAVVMRASLSHLLAWPTIDSVGVTNVGRTNQFGGDGPMSTTTPAFGAQILGQTEKALNAILDRQLAGTGLTEPDWITLTLTAASGGTLGRDQLASQVGGALKVSPAMAQARIDGLAAARLVQTGGGDEPQVTLTDAGQQLQARIRGAVTQITERMWGDLPAGDLVTAGRVLSVVLARANAELAAA